MGDEKKEVVLTFELLYEILRREKSREELQKVDGDFYSRFCNYVKEKESLLQDALRKSDVFSIGERDKLQLQLKNIQKVGRDLYDRREKKIIEMALNSVKVSASMVDTSCLLSEEELVFQSLVEVFTRSRKIVLSSEKKSEPKKECKHVKFVGDVEVFYGPSLEEYGPFKADQMVDLPDQVADVLIETGKAKEVT